MKFKVTRDPEEIKDWAESYGGKPMAMEFPDANADDIAVRLDFPGHTDDIYLSEGREYSAITWSEFFDLFIDQGLSFEYNPDANPDSSDWEYRFVKPTDADELVDWEELETLLNESEEEENTGHETVLP